MHIFTVKQRPDVAFSRDLFLYTGARPIRVECFMVHPTTSEGGWWIKQDGLDDDSEIAQASPGGTDNAAPIDNICIFTDFGFRLGDNARFVRNADHTLVMRTTSRGERPFVETFYCDLATAVLGTGTEIWSAAGAANAFDYAPPVAGELSWIRRDR